MVTIFGYITHNQQDPLLFLIVYPMEVKYMLSLALETILFIIVIN